MKFHLASRTTLLSMLFAIFLVAGCAQEADVSVEPAEQGDIRGAAAAASPDVGAIEEAESSRASVVRALDPTPCTLPYQSAIVINEIFADPVLATEGGADADGEWIELYNTGDTPVNLVGYSLSDLGGNFHQIGSNITIAPKGFAVLCRNDNPALNGGVTCDYQYLNFVLANTSGDAVILKDNNGDLVDQVVYTGTVPSGASMSLRNPYYDNATIENPANPNDPASWQGKTFGVSTTPFGNGDKGTPGAANSDVWENIEDPVCDDSQACTYDYCGLDGMCQNDWIDGCCNTNGDCVVDDICTTDRCVNHECVNEFIPNCCHTSDDCQDDNHCNADYCLRNRCRHSAYNIVPGCCYAPLDVHPFTGEPWASPEERQLFGDSQCDDKNDCTPDYCALELGTCYQRPPLPGCCNVAQDCDDGDPCTVDVCISRVCYNNRRSETCCTTDADCNDNNPCTTDRCIMNNCRFIWSATDCCFDNKFCEQNFNDGDPCTRELCVENQETGRFECQHAFIADCVKDLPYVETFDHVDSFTGAGYKKIDLPGSTPATQHWQLATIAGDLGPDKHILFDWFPNAQMIKTAVVSPTIDAQISEVWMPNQFTQQTTVQWRQAYKHAQPGTPITLRVIATDTGDFVGGHILWSATTTEDIPYDMISVPLPSHLKFSQTLKLGFIVDTGSSWSIAMESWEIDDVKVGAGVANKLVKSILMQCPSTGDRCQPPVYGTVKATSGLGEDIPAIEMGVCEWNRIFLCYYDEDGSQNVTWNTWGFPSSYVDGPPLDSPHFISQTILSQGYGCESNQNFVAGICGADSGANFYCAMDFKPNCLDNLAGDYIAGLVTKDEGDPLKIPQSPFESLVKVQVSVALEDGYLVYSPVVGASPSAQAIKDAIIANGRRAQIITDLDRISDLTRFDGVFVVLGVYGNYQPLSDADASTLLDYANNGGRIYLEGGEFFYTDGGSQLPTVLHDIFKVSPVADGEFKQSSPVNGANFLYGYNFDLSTNALYNSWNDWLVHVVGAGGREVLKDSNSNEWASVITYNGFEYGANYRSIASAVTFAGLIQQGGGKTVNELMGQYLNFLENGYPPCTIDVQCNDFEACTDDSCNAGECANEQRPNCKPCLNDKFGPDGVSLSCDINEACNLALGYCVPIEGQRFDINPWSCNKNFGAAPDQASCIVPVFLPGMVEDVQIKVKAQHYYRGDTEIDVTSPSGYTVRLKDKSIFDNMFHMYETYDVGVPSVGDLDTFNNTNLAGAWNVVIRDTYPALHNGLFEEWHLFAKYDLIPCDDDEDCPTDDKCATYQCVNEQCVPTPTDCDDGKECTIDSCDPLTGECIHEVIAGCGGECSKHAECAVNEACLACDPDVDDCGQLLERTCRPATDFDHDTGEFLCRCATIPGDIYPFTAGLPVDIPDNNSMGVTRSFVLEEPGFVNKLRVKVRTQHPSAGDLKATLCHDDDCLVLRQSKGGNNPGFFDIYDYDPVRSPGTMAELERRPLAGTWTIMVSDGLPSDTGALTEFTLYVEPADCYANEHCDDGNPCTVDVCQNPSTGGTCTHTLVTCEPSTDSCLANQCNPAKGLCEPVMQPNGTACEDGLYCTEDDYCQAGVCVGGTPRSCTALDTDCVVGSCNEDLRQCIPVAAEEGTPCDDGQMCTGGDQCVAGICHPGDIMLCTCPSGLGSECESAEDGNKCNGSEWICNAQKKCELIDGPVVCGPASGECLANVCDPADGICKEQQALNYTPCEDGLYCTISDFCLSGVCQGGEARSCAASDSACAVGICDDNVDACIADPKPEGTECENDGRGCTIDQCDGLGTCRYTGQNVSCSTIADDCNDGVCQNVGWGSYVCAKGPLPDRTVCTDEPNPCTEDICISGWCEHILLENCDGPCGGAHPFDAGDDMCGVEDSCENGYLGPMQGTCVPTCIDRECVSAASEPELGLIIDDKLGCVVSELEILTSFAYVDSVDVKVRLDHEYLADLVISLVDPQGYDHIIWNHIGGANQNMANTFDTSMPVPYPFLNPTQLAMAGVPMCSFKGEQASGTWQLKICDTGEDNGGVLRDWKLYIRGSNEENLNPSHRCETALDLGNQDVNPATTQTGDTTCAINSIADPEACGGFNGPDRVYKFNLGVPKRATIVLNQPDRDLVLMLKAADELGNCADGFLRCEQTGGWQPNAAPEEIDIVLEPGEYFIIVDTPGTAAVAPFSIGPFSFDLRVKTLLPNGANCNDPILGPQDMDCLSGHCQNGYCCDSGDCCPGNEWIVPADGTDPEAIKTTSDWISANAICPAHYTQDPYCFDADRSDPDNPINYCQGERVDANCINNSCVVVPVPDDSGCDLTVEADRCGLAKSVYCGDDGPLVPWVQVKPTCPGFCQDDADCDPGAHCDPAVATDPDPDIGYDYISGTIYKWCQADLPNGSASNEDSDCMSGHSANGYCCDSGDCCPSDDAAGAGACPAMYTVAPSCEDAALCLGQRFDPVCVNYQCGNELVRDDCACDGALSDNCGLYIPTFCGPSPTGTCPTTEIGGGEWVGTPPVCLDNCETDGQDDDTKCDDIARCDPCDAAAVDEGDCDPDELGKRVCMGNVPNGGACDENSDCENKLTTNAPDGRCVNGFCCEAGICCNQANDCPTMTPPSVFWAAPVCEDWATCQGRRIDAVCDQADFYCGSEYVDDDSACIEDPSNPSDDCGYFLPAYCNGAVEQYGGECLTSCLDGEIELDNLCDDGAHCDPDPDNLSNSICLPDLPNNEPCDEDSDCIGGLCQMYFCCEPGLLCEGARVASALVTTPSTASRDLVELHDPDAVQGELITTLGQPSVIGHRAYYNKHGINYGFLTSTTLVIHCWDWEQNGNETDVDCGGGDCKKCEDGAYCRNGARDCISGFCDNGVCATPSP